MYSGKCVGGITIPGLVSVRLLKADGGYHAMNTEFNVGQVWEVEFREPNSFVAPHIENVLITRAKLISSNNDIADVIDEDGLTRITSIGHPTGLFDGHLNWTNNRNGYISKTAIPSHSTGFWITDKDLHYDSQSKHYYYRDDEDEIYGFKYVGCDEPIEVIPAQTKIRVSLAKWWHPKDVDMEDRCYLQLSGWYL
jgi:hypothetical protein